MWGISFRRRDIFQIPRKDLRTPTPHLPRGNDTKKKHYFDETPALVLEMRRTI
jgi:hypothetical protein